MSLSARGGLIADLSVVGNWSRLVGRSGNSVDLSLVMVMVMGGMDERRLFNVRRGGSRSRTTAGLAADRAASTEEAAQGDRDAKSNNDDNSDGNRNNRACGQRAAAVDAHKVGSTAVGTAANRMVVIAGGSVVTVDEVGRHGAVL